MSRSFLMRVAMLRASTLSLLRDVARMGVEHRKGLKTPCERLS